MRKLVLPPSLKEGDKVAIVSLSSGILGESYNHFMFNIGKKRLQQLGLIPVFMPGTFEGIEYTLKHPEKRAEDLIRAFSDSSIKGIICAIGGNDTYKTIPYLMGDSGFCKSVRLTPKIFTGFSDTTVNHLMFYKLGMTSFYGPCFICDFAEAARDMLPYTKQSCKQFFHVNLIDEIKSSDWWYEERTDFSEASVNTERRKKAEVHGYELIQGESDFEGVLLGGCLETLYEMVCPNKNPDMYKICDSYNLFPDIDDWSGKILFLESSCIYEDPMHLKSQLVYLKGCGIFQRLSGILIGKPINEKNYEEIKSVYLDVLNDTDIPILYNINFGHSYPRTILGYGMKAIVNTTAKTIKLCEEGEINEK